MFFSVLVSVQKASLAGFEAFKVVARAQLFRSLFYVPVIIAGAYWFGMITKKINKMKQVEDKIASDLVELLSSRKTSAKATFITVLLISLIMVAAIAVLGGMIVGSITKPVANIITVINELINDNLSYEIDGTDRKDEIGWQKSLH